jgi:hypothetical protein
VAGGDGAAEGPRPRTFEGGIQVVVAAIVLVPFGGLAVAVLAGDPRENVVVDLAGPFQLQEMTCMLDRGHARRRGEQALGAAGQFDPDAAVVGSVQVQGGLRRLPAGGLLLGRVARGAIG